MEDHNDEMKSGAYRLIAVLSLAHMGIDFVCAFSLYHSFYDRPQVFLLYNFCAFALQLPIGIVTDALISRKKERYMPAACCTVLGILLTCTGAFISPLVTGLGNALFHTGGGILTINEDDRDHLEGRGLGVFVAPGALGLILGSLYHETRYYTAILVIVELILLMLGISLYLMRKEDRADAEVFLPEGIWMKVLICFVVVVLRSLCGMAIVFPWKNTDLHIIISVIALACGKTAGGFLGARFGIEKTVVISLALAAVSYAFADHLIMGLLALFLFNMTMPITLYLLAKQMKTAPGLAFGMLTFALFIGYLPVLYGYIYQVLAFPLGTIASLVSMILLLCFGRISNVE